MGISEIFTSLRNFPQFKPVLSHEEQLNLGREWVNFSANQLRQFLSEAQFPLLPPEGARGPRQIRFNRVFSGVLSEGFARGRSSQLSDPRPVS